jgi:hypothetical protein
MTAYSFFLKNAGYSVAQGETQIQGRRRSARELAQAEQWARENGVTFSWEPDQDADPNDWDGDGPIGENAEGCVARCASGGVLVALWSIWDASAEYRRVVQAELASEAMRLRVSVCAGER